MFRKILIIALLVAVLLLAGIFVWLNAEVVDLELAFAKVTVPVWQVFLIAFITGWVVGLLFSAIYILRLLNERRRLRKAVTTAETEVSALRTRPIQDAH